METHRVIKEALVTAITITLAAFILSYAINLGEVRPALSDLLPWTIIVALLSIGGKALSAVAGVSGAMRASIVAPETARYARGAVHTAHNELNSWISHLLGIVLSVLTSFTLSYVLSFLVGH